LEERWKDSSCNGTEFGLATSIVVASGNILRITQRPNEADRATMEHALKLKSDLNKHEYGYNLKYQVPSNQKQTQPTTGPEHHLRRALPLTSFLELLVSALDVLCGQERVFDQLRYVFRLYFKVLSEVGLKRGYF